LNSLISTTTKCNQLSRVLWYNLTKAVGPYVMGIKRHVYCKWDMNVNWYCRESLGFLCSLFIGFFLLWSVFITLLQLAPEQCYNNSITTVVFLSSQAVVKVESNDDCCGLVVSRVCCLHKMSHKVIKVSCSKSNDIACGPVAA